MEINSTLPSLEIQAALMVPLLGQVPGPRLPLALLRGDTPLCLPQPWARGSRLGGPACSLSLAEHGVSARLPPWCSWGCVTACSLLP